MPQFIGKWNDNLVIFVKIKINKIIPYPNPNYLKHQSNYNTLHHNLILSSS